MPIEKELSPSDLRCACDPSLFEFESTAEIEPLKEVIGQKRAVRAIEFGLDMCSPGYNIFVTGLEGTGKSTIVKDIVTQFAKTRPAPDDWCLVNNFKDEYRPRAIALPLGNAVRFKKRMNKFIDDLKNELPKAFADESYQQKLSAIQKKYAEQQRELIQQVEQSAGEKNIQISHTQTGFQTFPVVEGQPISQEQFQKLPENVQRDLKAAMEEIQGELQATVREMSKINQALEEALEKLSQHTAFYVINNRLETIKSEFKECQDVLAYLNEVREDIVENLKRFLPSKKKSNALDAMMPPSQRSATQRYQVNVLVDRTSQKGAPVIFEANPTYQNVFGQIEKRAYMGTVATDFSMVQAGSLLRANGGYLIMEIAAVLMNAHLWEALKRALQNKQLTIEDLATGPGISSASLRPEPIALDLKIILLGSYQLFTILQNHDSKFNKNFKVRADFDVEVERTEDTMKKYAQFVARVCKAENLLPVTPEGVAAIVEYGEKYIAHKNKLSLRFGPIIGVIKEADYWARRDKAGKVSGKYIIKAFTEYRFRCSLYEEKMHESYVDGTIMIDVDGREIGQVNALAVYQIGDFSFGRPSRITAETFMGQDGVINIERKAKLSGKTHDKGVLILSGYLGRTFAQKQPLNLSISLTFEQSYGGIDGDSASSTELYAILSSLGDIPIQQGLAVTGSVNQKGRIQAIGGVIQKIEGFFDVCKAKGLTGRQGVLIPQSNVKNLMLKKEVIDAVAEGSFHIYAVATVEEGIEILTGISAGQADARGNYPEESVYGRVQKKLEKYLEQAAMLKKKFEATTPDDG